MAEIKQVEKLDKKLIETGIIKEDFIKDYGKIHSLLNSNLKRSTKPYTEEIFEQGNEILREWLATQAKRGAAQEKLTSYLRCGFAHVCFDYIRSQDKEAPVDKVISRTIQSFKKRKYDKSYFKAGS